MVYIVWIIMFIIFLKSGFTIVGSIAFVLYSLMSIYWIQKVKLFYAALLANNSH